MEERRRLPKNVRQVGERDELYRVYLEDYVGTYLEKCLSRQGELTIGVLVGENCVIDGNACLFINGALEVNHVWLGEDQLMFSEYSWERMLDAKARHFEKGEICGAFVCAAEEICPDMAILQKLQNRYFPETGSIMMAFTGEDSAVYYQNMAGMARLAGYYVYYERNEAMQSFLVESSQGRVVEREGDEAVVNQFREKMTEKKAAKSASGLKFAYGLCVCLALAVCAIGINSLDSTQKLTEMEEVISGLLDDSNEVAATVTETDESGGKLTIYDVESGTVTAADNESEESQAGEESSEEETSEAVNTDAASEGDVSENAETEDGLGTETVESVAETVEESAMTGEVSGEEAADTVLDGGVTVEEPAAENIVQEEPVVAEDAVTEEPVAEEVLSDEQVATDVQEALTAEASDVQEGAENVEADSAAEAGALPEGCMIYTVSAGETLSTICINLYGSRDQVSTICELNNIEDANLISVGQELIVPSVQ